jgi:cleavage and polyadenylation specificity factor subunit 6/7
MALFVGDLHWWTTDAEIEAEFGKYGLVKEVRFFDEKASGKSKGYCHVEFFDPNVVSACKEGLNGPLFHGRPCVVAFASPNTARQSQGTNHQSMAAPTPPMQTKGGRGPGGAGGPQVASNYAGGRVGGPGGVNRGRSGLGMVNRGPVGNMRNQMGRNKQVMGMMQHLINSMMKEGTMGKRGHPRGSGPVHQRGGGKGRRIRPQHRIGQRRGVVMSKTWPETGIVTLTEIGSEIMIGRDTTSVTYCNQVSLRLTPTECPLIKI